MSCGVGVVTGALDELETPTITVLVRNIPSKVAWGPRVEISGLKRVTAQLHENWRGLNENVFQLFQALSQYCVLLTEDCALKGFFYHSLADRAHNIY